MDKIAQRAAVRRVLMYWGNAERARQAKAERIAELDQEINALYDLHPQILTGMPHSTAISDPTSATALSSEKKVAGLRATQARLTDEMNEMDRRASLIEFEVMCLPPLESEVIRLRYLKYGVAKKGYWVKIAWRVHVSEDHARRLERNGVDKLIKTIGTSKEFAK